MDLEGIRRYDEFWQTPTRAYDTESVRWGWWTPATVITKSALAPQCPEPVVDRTVVVLGAGPTGMLMAANLAHAGHRVTIIERQPTLFCGSTWNLSSEEFATLERTPPLSPEEWRSCITGSFSHGVFRLHDADSGGIEKDFSVADCLNVSLDEGRFYALLGREHPNLEVRTSTVGELEAVRTEGAYVSWQNPQGRGLYRAQLLIDARGWRSPLALAVHPHRKVESVYNMLGVVANVGIGWGQGCAGRVKRDRHGYSLQDAEGNPLGMICATYRNAIELDQLLVQGILERFTDFVPGSAEHDGRSDVIYYFTRTPQPARLTEMARGMVKAMQDVVPDLEEHHIQKVLYGHSPGYYAPGPFERWRVQASAGDRLLLLGTAAQQYSGLTGCAFGALARNAAVMGTRVDEALRRGDLRFVNLARIDIDPRERNSQGISGTFAGTMAVRGPDEDSCSPNRDWLILCEAAQKAGLGPELLGEAIKDKIRFETLNRLIAMFRVDPRVGEVMLRNNAGSEVAAVWTAIRGYLWLMHEEFRRFVASGKRKYLIGIIAALANLPGVLVSGTVVLVRYALHLRARRPDDSPGRPRASHGGVAAIWGAGSEMTPVPLGVRQSGWRGWMLAHGALLILNAASAAQVIMVCLAGEYRVLPTFGFIVVIDLAYAWAARKQRLPASGGSEHRV